MLNGRPIRGVQKTSRIALNHMIPDNAASKLKPIFGVSSKTSQPI